MWLPNYTVTFKAGKTAASTIKAYTPFTAQTGLDWRPVLVCFCILWELDSVDYLTNFFFLALCSSGS